MDQQVVTVDQFTTAMASIQEALASLRQEISGQQGRPPVARDDAQYDPTVPPPPPPSQSVPQAMPFTLHSQTGVAPPPITVPTQTSETHMLAWIGLSRHRDEGSWTGRASDDYSFPTILSGAVQRWFASLEASRRRTWDDLAQEFLRQFLFNTVVDVSRRELEALRQRAEESVSSFISRWRGKIAEIIDRPSERDQIQMVFEEPAAADRQTCDSSPSDVKGKKPFVRQRSTDVSAISSSSQRLPRHYQPISQLLETHPSCTPQQFRPRAPCPAFDQTYQAQPLALPYYATQGIERPPVSYTAAGQPCYVAQHALSQALRKLIEAGLLTALTPRPPSQPLPPHFRMDLHCAYHQGSGHETDRCTALRHAIQDLIDQVPPPDGGIHFLDFADSDDHVCMMSWDDMDPEPIELDDIYEMSSMSLGPQVPTPFRLFPETASVHASIVEPLISTCYSVQTPFVLVPDVEEFQAPHSDDPQTPNVQYILRGGRVLRQPPPAAAG
ncbi:hypothetical protein CK203_090780 [Vitis vinifera]|uniref:Retrotransposon gag domain-containing protein n=1 Tax=Vitis vinifera TaxID=29760 RepID=A0A438BU53_VITVI|nr:hypothetical protein CK203_090780 [Vitis vinifera]